MEQKIGASNGVISRAISKNTDILASWVSKIITAFPELNPVWLITGEGEMLIEDINNIDRIGLKNLSGLEKPHDINIIHEPHIEYLSSRYNVMDIERKSKKDIYALLGDTTNYSSFTGLYLPELGTGFHIRMTIDGDNMDNTIKNGDKIIATRVYDVKQVRPGYVYMIVDQNHDIMCNRVSWEDKNTVQLISDNSTYPSYNMVVSELLAFFRVVEIHTRSMGKPGQNDQDA